VAQQEPDLTGYITRVTSASDFDVNGIHVDVGDARIENGIGKAYAPGTAPPEMKPRLGEAAQVFGRRKAHAIIARRVILAPLELRSIKGSAILDAILPNPAGAAGDLLVRADGYPILLSSKTTRTFQPPLTANSPIQPNLWVSFHGQQRPDGIVVADSIKLSAAAVGPTEDELRQKYEYDPKAVDPKAKQRAISKSVFGLDPKKIPPYADVAMQARIDAIGQKLVPKYQRDLASDNPTRINFRFQLIDEPNWRDAYSLPSGIVLIPYQLIARMQNDSQIATVLADNIGCALEKQTLKIIPKAHAATAAELGGDVVGVFVPGVSLIGSAAGIATVESALRRDVEQSGRVSLGLLHDGGYDLTQAPLAWWLLAPRKPKPIAEIGLPYRAQYLYYMLGTTWPEVASAQPDPHP